MAELAKHVIIDRDQHGVPRITIDGTVLPWFTSGIAVPAPSLDEVPTVTITIPADKVSMLNEVVTPGGRSREGAEPGFYRCRHRGCGGYHQTPNQQCC